MEFVRFSSELFVQTTVPTEYGSRSLFLIVVCIRDDRTKLLASVGLAQARPNYQPLHVIPTQLAIFV